AAPAHSALQVSPRKLLLASSRSRLVGFSLYNSTMAEVDLTNRDPNALNNHLSTAFEDVLGEPDGIHSMDCVWRNSYSCFNCGKNCLYKVCTLLCGIFIALYWGCVFAAVAMQHIWCITPSFKVWEINMACMRHYSKSIVDCCLGPCCETCGLFLSNMKLTQTSG
uniref:Caveolin n=1 Tax=Macrostomum lignano TaxID=282301 RepID=A0A1I8GFP4_9PLAT